MYRSSYGAVFDSYQGAFPVDAVMERMLKHAAGIMPELGKVVNISKRAKMMPVVVGDNDKVVKTEGESVVKCNCRLLVGGTEMMSGKLSAGCICCIDAATAAVKIENK